MFAWVPTLFRVVWWVFSRLWVPFMAIGWPLMICYGAIWPREADMVAVRHSGHEVPLLIGQAWGGSACTGNDPCIVVPANRSYLVFPDVLTNAAVTIVEDGSQGPTVTDMPGYALLLVAIWFACSYGTWYFWVRPLAAASNHRIERPRAR